MRILKGLVDSSRESRLALLAAAAIFRLVRYVRILKSKYINR